MTHDAALVNLGDVVPFHIFGATVKFAKLIMTSLFLSQHTEPFYDEPDRKNYNSYRMYLSSPQGYGEESYEDEPVHLTPSSPDGYASQALRFKANTNYVDFYSTTRRPSNRANKFTGSPDSWV